MLSASPRLRWGSLLAFTLLLTPAGILAQGPGTATAKVTYVTAEPAPPPRAPAHDIPAPPRVIRELRAEHVDVPLPIGTSNVPLPTDPPVSDGPAGPGGPCDISYFVDNPVTPTGSVRGTVGEPTAIANRHVSFQTGNWYAALSQDAGMSWSYIDPNTRFAQIDNSNFCCDQIAVYVPQRDMTLWLMQHDYDPGVQRGSFRLAVARDRNELTNDAWAHSFVLYPQLFGQPAQRWFDFPDLACTDDYLYISYNVFDPARVQQNAIVMKILLADVEAGGQLPIHYWTKTGALGAIGSYRFTRGAGTRMYWASHISTAQLRIYRSDDSSMSMTSDDRFVAPWVDTNYVALAPNGVNWAGKASRKITGGYVRPLEYGFLWTAATSAGRPHPYIRVARFDVATNSLIGENDLWSSTNALMYPATAVNATGDVGLVLARGDATGSGTRHPTTAVRIVDSTCQTSFGGGSLSQPFAGGTSPNDPKWGDYFSVQQHPVYPDTFVGTGMTMRSSGVDGTSEPHYLWFGYEPTQPAWTRVAVLDNVSGGSPAITVLRTDLDGLTDGTTTFSRRYMASQPYELRAPLEFDVGSDTYRFCRWRYRADPSGSFVDQPDGERTLTVASIGSADDTAIAEYVLKIRIEVRSINPSSGIPITVSEPGLNGSQDGTTPFNRSYKIATPVTFTAPAQHGAQPFKQWLLNGVPRPLGQLSMIVAPNVASTTVEAEYYTHVAGDVVGFGQGCLGSNGLIPDHFVVKRDAQIGEPVKYEVRNVFGATAGAMFLGLSNTTWNGVPLPLQLDLLGLDKTCWLLVAADLSLSMNTVSSGNGAVSVTMPDDPSLIGVHVYTQLILVDPRVASTLSVIVSNGLDTRLGGNR